MPTGTRPPRDTVVAAGITLLAAVLWAPLWSGERTLFIQDTAAYFFPMKDLLAHAVKTGEWPWWNPWIRNGLPFYANPQVGLFYPGSVPFYLLPTALAFNWVVVLHFAIAGTGFYAWWRRSGRSWPAALVGAVAVSWGGVAVSLTNYLNNLQAFAWIGWTLWAWEGWVRRGGVRWLAVAAVGLVLVFLAGEPQIAVLTAVLAVALAWLEPAGRVGARRWWAPVAAIAAAAIASLVVAAVQLVPTVELFLLSGRSAGLPVEESLLWSLPPLHASNLVLPRSFDGQTGFDFVRLGTVGRPWIYTSYVGAVTLVLATGAADRRRAARALFWAGAAVVGVALALGAHNPVVAWLAERAPILRLARYPEKFLVLPAIAIPALAALGVDALGERGAAARRIGVAAGGLAAVVLLARVTLGEGAVGALAGGVEPAPVLEGLRRGLLHALVFALAAGGLALASRALPFGAAGALLAAVVVVDLTTANLDAVPIGPADMYEAEPAVLEPLPRDRLETTLRIRTTPLGRHAYRYLIPPELPPVEEQRFLLQTMGPNLAMLHRVLAQDGAEAFRPRGDDFQAQILQQLPHDLQVRYLRLASTGYALERRVERLPEGLEPLPVGPIRGLRLYRVVDPLPRAYLVLRAVVEPDSVAALNRLLAGGEDPHEVAYVDRGPGLDGPARRVEGGVRWLPGTNHAVRLDVVAPAPALLVLTDNWYPGWRASVDGRPVELARANWHFRAVYLSPGRHRVRFDYRPRGIGWAALASGVGLLGLGSAIALGGRRGA